MSYWTWSQTAASNTSVGGISIDEGMNPSAVNNAMRGQLAEQAAWVSTITGGTASGTVGGTADAITLAPTVALVAYAVNQRYLFKAGGPNTVSNPTLNVSGVGAKTIKLQGGTALPVPAWATNDMVLVAYDGTDLILIGTTKHDFSNAAANVATKAVPVLADRALHQDSAASNAPKYSTWQTVFDMLNTLTQKSTPTTSDKVPISDAAASGVAKYATIADILAILIASQAQMEAASVNTAVVTPGRQHFHPGVAKAWANFDGTATGTNAPTTGYGVTSITRNSTGNYTVNLSITASAATYAVLGFAKGSTISLCVSSDSGDTKTTTAFQIRCRRTDTGGGVDGTEISVFVFGDL